MSTPTNKTLAKIDNWLTQGTSIQTAFPQKEQQYRMMVCSEFYKRWLSNHDIDPRTVCKNIARRDYADFIAKASLGNEEAQEMIRALRITIDDNGNILPRTVTEIQNDVMVCNHIIRFFQTDETPRHRAMFLDSAEWLIREGKKTGNDKAVGKGMDSLAKIYGDFQEKEDAASEMPNANINISDDPTIVKIDAHRFTDEEMEAANRRYGVSKREAQALIQDSDGTWVMPAEEPEEDEERDVIEDRDPTLMVEPNVIKHIY